MKQVVIIGAGFGGLSAAGFLAKHGFSVTVVEQLAAVGGRAQQLVAAGYRFDIGPSWYWMPDEHDAWFTKLGFQRELFYTIQRLSPSYRVYFADTDYRMPTERDAIIRLFDSIEVGAGENLKAYLNICKKRYEVAMQNFVYRSFNSVFDFIDPFLIKHVRLLAPFKSLQREIESSFHHAHLQKMLTYPVVFLGSHARSTPALYSLMNWIDFGLGTWYPKNGFTAVVNSMRTVCEQLGVKFMLKRQCRAIHVKNNNAYKIDTYAVNEQSHGEQTLSLTADIVVANADYHYVDQTLLPATHRSYSKRYWSRRALAPAIVGFYIGLDITIPQLEHHTFFFDSDWEAHFDAVYNKRAHIEEPLFYIHSASISDSSRAPQGGSTLFILIPIAPNIADTAQIRAQYFKTVCARIQTKTGVAIEPHIKYYKAMSINEFKKNYNAYKGNAFGLGHTFLQTAAFRPKNKSRTVKNLYYCGHYTIPGTGTTMSMISGEVVAQRIISEHTT